MTADRSPDADGELASEVPGWLDRLSQAVTGMPVPVSLRPPAVGGRPAAVLILFADGPAGPDLLFLQRAADLRKHPGQPAFPGGAIDEADGGPVGAALREAAEETGLDPGGIRVLAVMPELYITRSDFRVTPVLAWWHSPVPVAPGDLAEVAAVIRIPVADLSRPSGRISVRYPSGQTGPAFRAAGLIIWGFTALLLDQLLALGGWAQPWQPGQVITLGQDELPAGWPPAAS